MTDTHESRLVPSSQSWCHYESLDLPATRLLFGNFPRRFRAWIQSIKPAGSAFHAAEKLRARMSGPALVLANGPSLISTIQATRGSAEGSTLLNEAKIFAVNEYILHETLVGLRPDFYVLADPLYLGHAVEAGFTRSSFKTKPSSATYGAFSKPLAEVPQHLSQRGLMTFVPQEHLVAAETLGLEAVPFAKTDLASSNLTDIRRPLGIPPLSVYVALIVAYYLGFSPIYHAGLDSDAWLSLRRSAQSGCLEFDYTHFYEESADLMTVEGGVSTAYFLEHFAQIYRTHERLCGVIGAKNLSPTGLPI